MKILSIQLDRTSVLELLAKSEGKIYREVKPQPEDQSYDCDVPYDWVVRDASRKKDITYSGTGPDKKDLWFDDPDEVIEFLQECEKCPYGKQGDLLWISLSTP